MNSILNCGLSLHCQHWWILRLQKREWALEGKSALFFYLFLIFLNNKTEHLWLHWNLGLCQLSVDGGSTPNWLLKHFFFTMSSMLAFTSRGRGRDIAAVPAHSVTIILVPRHCTHMRTSGDALLQPGVQSMQSLSDHAALSWVREPAPHSPPTQTLRAAGCAHTMEPYFLCPPASVSLCPERCFLLAQQLRASGGPGNPARRTPFQCILP